MSRKAALAISPVTKERREPMPKRRFQIDQLIINSPNEEPSTYWSYDREVRMFERKDGAKGNHKRVAVKIIDDRGIESLKIVAIVA